MSTEPISEPWNRLKHWSTDLGEKLNQPDEAIERGGWDGLAGFVAKTWATIAGTIAVLVAICCAYGYSYREEYLTLLRVAPKPGDFHLAEAFTASYNAHPGSFFNALFAPINLSSLALFTCVCVAFVRFRFLRNAFRMFVSFDFSVSGLLIRFAVAFGAFWLLFGWASSVVSAASTDALRDTVSYVSGQGIHGPAVPLHFTPLEITFTAEAERRLPPDLVDAAKHRRLLLVDEDGLSITVVIRPRTAMRGNASFPVARTILKSALFSY